MKKHVFILLIGLLFIPTFFSPKNVFAANLNSMTIRLNNDFIPINKEQEKLSYDQIYNYSIGIYPKIINNNILFPTILLKKHIGNDKGINYNWDNKNQTLSITRNDKSIKLKSGSNTAWINNNKLLLDVPVIMEKGNLFVPIRPVIEALNEGLIWDESNKVLYIYHIDSESIKDLHSDDLKTARKATLKLERIKMLQNFEKISDEQRELSMSATSISFPEKEASRFFISSGYYDTVSYYEIRDNVAWEIWRAKAPLIGEEELKQPNDIVAKSTTPISEQIGIRPTINKDKMIYFLYSDNSSTASYGYTTMDSSIELGTITYTDYADFICDIPEE